MKITQEPKEFKPITITLENERDACRFLGVLRYAMGMDAVLSSEEHSMIENLESRMSMFLS